MKFSNRRNRQNAEISMLNLIDVIFMLLIFFMIATTFNKYSQFQLSIPKSDAKFDKKEETKAEIIVNREKKYFLKLGNNVKEISGENIHNEILRLPKEMLENMTLTADEHLEYGYIVEIMSKLRNENVKNVSLNIQKNDK
ncbi:ExbD/TolR family protein [Leptotrichia sp. HSP-334]|uniref:Biopolymertransporter ExbD/TolR n=3 Tax=Leptotrichia TaxID=32067 RepID=A0A510KLI7_9FUSO|nr:biopolymer transporter ExbD [Leptotrichia wadei]ERK53749.1 transport energizing protein, ExbD/TolR family [Leptotrichia wadei F0279]BBM43658.1 biopolymertransporter ExbD/TolR [Leptotrichia wadei]BBM48492.1 biopolymertransporter ExbD/TolR [Leptotrichia wadei]BBM50783.1 biopolymertransporter ExbD/TolR [Leptotrichia wadei]